MEKVSLLNSEEFKQRVLTRTMTAEEIDKFQRAVGNNDINNISALGTTLDFYDIIRIAQKEQWHLRGDQIIPFKRIMDERNSEARRNLIVIYGVADFFGRLVQEGQGRIILEPVDENDYQNGLLWEVEYTDDVGTQTSYLLEVYNGTKFDGWEKMSAEEKQEKGLTADGREKFWLRVPKQPYTRLQEAWDTTFGLGDEDDEEFERVTGIKIQDLGNNGKIIEA